MTSSSLCSSIALVTGASSGIGAECARLLAERGYHLILVARREEHLKALKVELEGKYKITVHPVVLDLSREQAAFELHRIIQHHQWQVDLLINNAGFGIKGSFEEMDPARLIAMIHVNITTLTLLTRLVGADMISQGGGKILQVSSIGAFQPCPWYAAYSATKAYVLSLGEALYREMKPHGVTVTTLYPGLTWTEFFKVSGHTPKSLEKTIALSAREVATLGLTALFKGRRAVITGRTNRLNAFFIKLIPRSWAAILAGKAVGK